MRVAAIALAVLLIADWCRAPRVQWSVRAYDLAVIGTYRVVFRPVTSRFTRCRFRPTCSQYSEEAMHAHGFAKGICLTIWRLVRCGPWTAPGTPDPVR